MTPLTGSSAVVSAGSREAANVGSAVLASGGNAVDAVIAAAAVQCIRELPWCGLGGDGFALISSPDGHITTLNGAGAVPRALRNARIPGGRLPRFGPLSVSTPGVVDAWWRLWQRFGTRPFSELLEPAADLAERGFEMDTAFAGALSRACSDTEHDDPFHQEFCQPNGSQPGETFRLPTLSRTLRDIGVRGPEVFYSGPLGREVVETVSRRKGLLSVDDLAIHSVDFEAPITVRYGNAEVSVTPPVSMGWVLLQQLLLFEALEGSSIDDLADRIDLMVRCKHAAFSDLALLPSRQDTADVVDVLASDNIDRWCEYISSQRANNNPPVPDAVLPASTAGSDTTCVSVADSAGMIVTFIHSLFNEFGSRVVVPGTGIVLNDRLAKQPTSLADARSANGPTRPLHTLVAYHVADSQRRFAGATPGGRGQVQTNFQVLHSIIDDGATLQSAVDAPRWLSGAPRLPDADDLLFLERQLKAQVGNELASMGHRVAPTKTAVTRDMFGSCTIAGVNHAHSTPSGSAFGAADSRRNAFVAEVSAPQPASTLK